MTPSKMDPMVGSGVTDNGKISDSSDNADLLDFCFLCSRQFFHESLDNYGTERLKDEEILETFFEELGPVDRSLLQCCPACKALCKILFRTKEALSSLIDEITSLLLRSRKVSYLLSKSRVVSRLFQSSNSSLPPCESSTSYFQQPLSQINFAKDVSNNTIVNNNSNNCFPTQFDLRLDGSNLSVGDSLDLGLSHSIPGRYGQYGTTTSTSVIKRSPLSKANKSKQRLSSEIVPCSSGGATTFSSILLNESIMNSVSDNACDILEGVIVRASNNKTTDNSNSPNKSFPVKSHNNRMKVESRESPPAKVKGGGVKCDGGGIANNLFSETESTNKDNITSFSDFQSCKSISTVPDFTLSSDYAKCKNRDFNTPPRRVEHVVTRRELQTEVNKTVHLATATAADFIEMKGKEKHSSNNSKLEDYKKLKLATPTPPAQSKQGIYNYKGGGPPRRKIQSQNAKGRKKKCPKFRCDLCGKLCHTVRDLRNHLGAHSQERKFICEICGISYRHKTGLEAHVAIHNGEPKFQCGTCRKIFTQKAGLQRHMRIHTGKYQFQCDKCGKQFIHHTSFSAHKMTHDAVKNFACTECSLTFHQKSHLQRHMSVHTGEKPHQCSLCERSFAAKYNLQVHLKSHHEETGLPASQHPCTKCNKVFTRKFKLKQHQSHVHNNL